MEEKNRVTDKAQPPAPGLRAGLAAYNDKGGGSMAGSTATQPAAGTAGLSSGTGSTAMPEVDRRSWDILTSKVEDLGYQQAVLTNRLTRLDDFGTRLALAELASEQAKVFVREATEEFKLKLETFKERLF